MSNAITADVKSLVQKELDSANEKFPPFNSPHEGYAVILEEVDEASIDMACIKDYAQYAWGNVKANADPTKCIKDVKSYAINLACEAIQIAAMCAKFLDMNNELKEK